MIDKPGKERVEKADEFELLSQICEQDVVRAEQQFLQLSASLEESENCLNTVNSKIRWLNHRHCVFNFLQQVRTACNRSGIWRPAILLIGTTFLAGLAVIFARLNTSDGGELLFSGVLGVGLGLVSIGILLFYPSDISLQENLKDLRNELDNAEKSKEVIESKLLIVQNQYEKAHRNYQKLKSALESRRYRLLNTNWQAMRSVEFEEFLQEVFEKLGYFAEMTKTSGDQGVDLIVSSPQKRIAIQVKGYFNSVSNSAVQQAHAGMAYYRCDSCAVITNSVFTPSAKDLAGRIGCILIEGDQIPDLIKGKIRL